MSAAASRCDDRMTGELFFSCEQHKSVVWSFIKQPHKKKQIINNINNKSRTGLRKTRRAFECFALFSVWESFFFLFSFIPADSLLSFSLFPGFYKNHFVTFYRLLPFFPLIQKFLRFLFFPFESRAASLSLELKLNVFQLFFLSS